MIQDTMTQIWMIKEKMKIAQERQKKYADVRLKKVKFEEGHKVFLKVSPTRGVRRFEENLSYEEQPLCILDQRVKELRGKSILLLNILWRNHNTEEVTWEKETDMKARCPTLFHGKS